MYTTGTIVLVLVFMENLTVVAVQILYVMVIYSMNQNLPECDWRVQNVHYKVTFDSSLWQDQEENLRFSVFLWQFCRLTTKFHKKLYWYYWSTSGAGNLITGCCCVTGRLHFPSRGVFQEKVTQQIPLEGKWNLPLG